MKKLSKVAALLIIVVPFLAQAINPFDLINIKVPYGGRVKFFIPCTCEPPKVMIYFDSIVPLGASSFLGPLGSLLPVDALTYNPTTATTYRNSRVFTPRMWDVGMFRPISSCFIATPVGCVPILPPPLGAITDVGSS
ncbi:MAG: hypothetical protein WA051_01550 [Minisyncoccia bacterium]